MTTRKQAAGGRSSGLRSWVLESLQQLVRRPATRLAVLFLAALLPAMTAATTARAQVYQAVSSSTYSSAGQVLTFTYTYNTGSYTVSALSITG